MCLPTDLLGHHITNALGLLGFLGSDFSPWVLSKSQLRLCLQLQSSFNVRKIVQKVHYSKIYDRAQAGG